jgi:hypothetical protein
MPDRLREDLGLLVRGSNVRDQFGSAFNDLGDQVIEVDRTAVLQAGPDKLIDLAVQAIGHPNQYPATKRRSGDRRSRVARGARRLRSRHGSQASAPSSVQIAAPGRRLTCSRSM